MKTKYFFLAALVGLAFAGCSSDDLIAEAPPVPVEETVSPILFSSNQQAFTRADFTGKEAADLLGNMFVVSGKKGATTASTTGSIVFDNYLVEYAENTAHTTESNVANWEYVGKGRIKHAIDHGITSQTIKYWDYSQNQYDFIAWSAGSKTPVYDGTPAAGQVLVSAINPNTLSTAYTFTGTAADLSECYIADLVTVKKADYANYQENPVTFRFRQLGTKVRVGIYETIPGYSVKNVKFYTQGGTVDPATEIVDNATLFTAAADIYTEGTYTVSFPTVDTPASEDNNQAHVSFVPKSGVAQTTIVDWGSLNYTIAEDGEKTPGSVFLGRTSNTATMAGDPNTNYYVIYLPNESGANLNLRVNFVLESTDGSGEVIEVKNARAQVPSIYTTWKPGFAYTYLFKISDKTNGRTGVYDPTQPDNASVNSDPAGLYPITFDAVVVNADEDATQETITTVMTPSITSYQQKSTVVNADEYTVNGNDIFVTVNEGDNIVDITGKAAVYIIPAGKTEADVVDALQMQDDNAASLTIKGRSGLVLDGNGITSSLTNTVEFGADGNAIEISASTGENKALRFTPAAGTTYAFVYTKTAPDAANNVEKYEALNWSSFVTGQTKYRYAYKNSSGDAQKGVKYFSLAGGVYTMETAFIGQGVSNLYLDATGTTIASGYARTGVTYYYTTNNGMSYQTATNIRYEDFGTTALYKDPTLNTLKTETSPADGQAYYDASGKYCVILPQQTNAWYELDTTTYVEATETAEVVGQTYFDKYIKNDGVYYAKVIKVQ